ncbi:transcriptional regulator [Streptomyces sparsogenes DSM 40356]|uniref:Transcriptional regulator n=1 Tax=Streptomyces sparsogenes DSM 40356 TaxID=1331668 RepID=A0A1R1SED1_9ACTN|nr:transcriptional regulator [Streptomyces sparsogenes DSM 40356]
MSPAPYVDRGLLGDASCVMAGVVQVSRSLAPAGQIEAALRGAGESAQQARWVTHGLMAVEEDRATLPRVCDRPPDPDELGEQSRRVIEALSTHRTRPVEPVFHPSRRGSERSQKSDEQGVDAPQRP